MNTMTTPKSVTAAQLKQVTSLLRDRQQCVTVAGIAQDLSISRTAASELLQAVAADGKASWQATLCETKETSETQFGEAVPCAGRCFAELCG